MVENDEVPPALLFSGPSGVGKTTAARILANTLEATDVIEVDAASNGGVDAIRTLLDVVRYSTGGGYRVLVLDEAQSITAQGWEALLTTLEEPPAMTVFVLCSTEPGKFPRNIRSRLIQFAFNAISENDILDRLRYVAITEGLDPDMGMLAYIAQRSRGDVRAAIQALDMAVRADTMTLTSFLELTGETDSAPLLVAAMLGGDHAKVFTVLDSQLAVISPARVVTTLIEIIRDLLIVKAGGEVRTATFGVERRARLAQLIERDQLLIAAKILWDVPTQMRAAENPRETLELAVILITAAFSRNREPSRPVMSGNEATKPAPRPLTLAEMQQTSRKDNVSETAT